MGKEEGGGGGGGGKNSGNFSIQRARERTVNYKLVVAVHSIVDFTGN